VATFITLILVPVFYSIFVFDLKWIKWDVAKKEGELQAIGGLPSEGNVSAEGETAADRNGAVTA
jgi:hypothetical protein